MIEMSSTVATLPTAHPFSGVDPATGRRATWQVVPVTDADGGFRVERADGDITHPAVWMQASKTATVMGADEVRRLVAQVSGSL